MIDLNFNDMPISYGIGKSQLFNDRFKRIIEIKKSITDDNIDFSVLDKIKECDNDELANILEVISSIDPDNVSYQKFISLISIVNGIINIIITKDYYYNICDKIYLLVNKLIILYDKFCDEHVVDEAMNNTVSQCIANLKSITYKCRDINEKTVPIDLSKLYQIKYDVDVDNLFDEPICINYETLLGLDPISESIALDKASGNVKNLYLNINSYIKDIVRKWQGIQEIPVSKNCKKSVEKIMSLSKKLCDHIGEILKTNNNISYETDYEEFLEEVKRYKNNRKDKDRTETITISTVQSHVKYIENKANQYLKMNTDSKFNKKYKNAIYIVQSRTLYVLNTLLYNASGKGAVGNIKSDKKAGIANKRYGSSETRINIKKLDGTSTVDILKKLRNATSYNTYKKLFDEVLSEYNRSNVSALKMVDLEKHNKLVFLTYGSMKPMTLKKGTKLYHISKNKTIAQLNPVFKCRDNITFYAKPRVYFIDKLVNPKSVLPDATDANIYEYTCTKDTIAYRDNEYGSWFHHCLYVESEKPFTVKNITNEVMDRFTSKKKASKDGYMSDASGKIDKNKLKEQNEWTEYVYENELLLLNEDSSDEIFSINEANAGLGVIKDMTQTAIVDTINKTKDKLNDEYKKFKKMTTDDKKKNINRILTACKNALKTISMFTGVGFVKSGVKDIDSNKKFMRDLKRTMPMNHETYNTINKKLAISATLKIVAGIVLMVINLVLVYKLSGKTISKSITSMTNYLGKIAKNSAKDEAIKAQSNAITNNLMKLLNMGIIHENIELYDVVDIINESTLFATTSGRIYSDTYPNGTHISSRGLSIISSVDFLKNIITADSNEQFMNRLTDMKKYFDAYKTSIDSESVDKIKLVILYSYDRLILNNTGLRILKNVLNDISAMINNSSSNFESYDFIDDFKNFISNEITKIENRITINEKDNLNYETDIMTEFGLGFIYEYPENMTLSEANSFLSEVSNISNDTISNIINTLNEVNIFNKEERQSYIEDKKYQRQQKKEDRKEQRDRNRQVIKSQGRTLVLTNSTARNAMNAIKKLIGAALVTGSVVVASSIPGIGTLSAALGIVSAFCVAKNTPNQLRMQYMHNLKQEIDRVDDKISDMERAGDIKNKVRLEKMKHKLEISYEKMKFKIETGGFIDEH